MKLPDLRVRVLSTLLLVVVIVSYFIFNRIVEPQIDLSTHVDKMIPFFEPFVVLYLTYFVFLWGAIIYGFFYFPTERYRRFVNSLVIIQVVAYVFYVIIPGKIVRPEILGNGFFLDLVREVYRIDMPSSLTPSLHVSNSWLVALTLDDNKVIRFAVVPWAVLIVASTLLIKQHHLIDVLSGLGLSTIVYLTYSWYYTSHSDANTR